MMSRSGLGVAVLALFLKYMQHKYRFLKFDRVNGPVCATAAILDDLQDSCTAKTLKHLGRIMLVAALCEVQRMAEKLPNGAQGAPYVLLAPPEYLIVRFHTASVVFRLYEKKRTEGLSFNPSVLFTTPVLMLAFMPHCIFKGGFHGITPDAATTGARQWLRSPPT